ncbi:MAG: hypothetical protein VKI42_01030 [Synechococcaceae cyanobacterium]|nr:hypothetical protein [Synechococcaceae cyanobacterium]
MKALIDTEVFLFRAAAACEFEAEWAPDDWTYLCRHADAQALFQDAIGEIRDTVPDHEPVLAFSDRLSFRYGIWPQYKANRKSSRKPAGYGALVEWVERAAAARGWKIARLPDVEADDVLGVLYEEGDIIVSTDKDLLTVPGLHLRSGELLEVSRVQADRNFFSQVLTGDTSDNYPGCPTFGPKTAEKWLAGWEAEADLWREVVNAFMLKGGSATREAAEQQALQQARCARILRPGEYDLERCTPLLWEPPVA